MSLQFLCQLAHFHNGSPVSRGAVDLQLALEEGVVQLELPALGTVKVKVLANEAVLFTGWVRQSFQGIKLFFVRLSRKQDKEDRFLKKEKKLRQCV